MNEQKENDGSGLAYEAEQGLLLVRKMRRTIARFIGSVSDQADDLKSSCEENEWNDDVLFTLKDGLAKLGVVLSALETWEADLGIPKDTRAWLSQHEEAE